MPHGQDCPEEKTVSESTSLVSEIRHYARQIWLAGLGAYSRLGTEGSDYFKELVKAGEALEKKGKSLVTSQVDSANDSVKTGLSSVKGKSKTSSTGSSRHSTAVSLAR